MIQRLLLAYISWYQSYGKAAIASLLPFGGISGCRQWPTCSEYAKQAIREQGVLRGGFAALRRTAACHPFASLGGSRISGDNTHVH